MIKQLAIIFGCLLAGEAVAMIPGLTVPGSVIGLLLLTLLLQLGVVQPKTIEPLCRILTRNMAFFFVPAGVGLMLYFDVVAREWLPIAGAIVVSTFIVMVVTGRLHQLLHHVFKKRLTRSNYGRVLADK